MINIQTKKNKRGFIILFAVTLASLLLSIALGIGNVVFREATFSVSGKDSNEAFLAADTATECVLFHDKLNGGVFPLAGPAPASISCGGNTINVTGDFTVPKKAFYRFTMQNLGSAGTGCATMRLEKDGTKIPNTYNLISKGYNSDCPNLTLGSTNPHLVEREIIITSSVGTPPSFQPPAATVVLTALPSSITSNSATTLMWETHSVVNCSATSGPWSGPKPFGNGSESTGILTETQTYQMTCDDAQDSNIHVSGSVTVTVLADVIFTSSGSFTVPAYTSLTAQCWGGGGGGGSDDNATTEGTAGGTSSFGSISATGGSFGNSDAAVAFPPKSAGGSGGDGLGGDTNSTGVAGENAANVSYGGAGGAAAGSGGSGGARQNSAGVGAAGTAPGGGGGGGYTGAGSNHGGGGGGGGYVSKTYTAGQLTGSVTVTIGAGGAGGNGVRLGGAGARGECRVTWN